MIVPEFWSESKIKKVVDGRQFTIKRFGWSDTSEEDAKKHSEERLKEAVATLEAEKDVRRIDHKTSYNGAEGIPIREEVVSRHQDVVVSRNSYGALCINTPDVLFADIDFEFDAPFQKYILAFAILAVCALLTRAYFDSWVVPAIGLFLAALFTSTVAASIHKVALSLRGGAEKVAIKNISKISDQDKNLNLRIYRTPLGLRVLVMNRTYSPTSNEAIELLKKFKSDRIYVQMCKNQHCFRARVSPKPWRIGLDRLKPRPGVWPIKEERMAERVDWVRKYDLRSEHYSSCRFLMSLGGDDVDPKAEFVRQLHDELCKSDQPDLKIA
ncbi:hypothetical protein [Motiliproteus sp. MSK22-1]|uniref:hypothetical protein n=1 Tax=Motiliproteus sp. MSK22-1 TaxID=1897630 RepID=UPI0009784EF1|nr:hypothetical protein [Motiliproteus sp. MSK22-1]OMH28021.1 hypothetical protein BGP75_21875 [Motiliproteus sp. MSK22-1]